MNRFVFVVAVMALVLVLVLASVLSFAHGVEVSQAAQDAVALSLVRSMR